MLRHSIVHVNSFHLLRGQPLAKLRLPWYARSKKFMVMIVIAEYVCTNGRQRKAKLLPQLVDTHMPAFALTISYLIKKGIPNNTERSSFVSKKNGERGTTTIVHLPEPSLLSFFFLNWSPRGQDNLDLDSMGRGEIDGNATYGVRCQRVEPHFFPPSMCLRFYFSGVRAEGGKGW